MSPRKIEEKIERAQYLRERLKSLEGNPHSRAVARQELNTLQKEIKRYFNVTIGRARFTLIKGGRQ